MKFAESLECTSKVLADNCGKKGRVETLSELYKSHFYGSLNSGDESPTKANLTSSYMGLNIDLESEDILIDCKANAIYDHLTTKLWAIKHSLEAVLTVLRVDHIIMSKQAGGPKQ